MFLKHGVPGGTVIHRHLAEGRNSESPAEDRSDPRGDESRAANYRCGDGHRDFLGKQRLERIQFELVIEPVEILLHRPAEIIQQRLRVRRRNVSGRSHNELGHAVGNFYFQFFGR